MTSAMSDNHLVHPRAEDLELPAVLHALSDPVRLQIVRSLSEHGACNCGTFAVPVAKSTLSHHLRVLRDAGLVESRVEAQRRVYRVRPEPLVEIDAWLAPFRRFWSRHVDALERHLDRMDHPPRAQSHKKKGKKR